MGNLVFLILFLFSGCGKETQPVTLAQGRQREELREAIKRRLGPEYEQPLPPATEAQIRRGAELYPKLCAPCHGGRGDGAGHNATAILGKPSDFTDPQAATFFSEQGRLFIIKKGAPGTAMMGWEKVLPEKDILALYYFIRTLIEKE